MLFNSIDFAVFLPIVFLLYWFVANKSLKLQNILIVIASYVFYSWWDYRFLALIIFSTLVDYTIGLKLKVEENQTKRKVYLWTSIAVNITLLGFFKYYDFFLDNFITAFTFFGSNIKANTLNIILPIGISFYTFQTLSYTIDVYNKKLEPTKDFIAFSAFVSFFPQLVAGPIERARNLLPQFYANRTFDYSKAVDGLRQILWGLFKKIVIADNCADYANLIFNNSNDYSGGILVLGAIFFAFQVYGDFSGYSDIAIGTSRLFGFNLMTNFNFPYFSRNFEEFWRRWHISLSTWFRDYLYIPLGGNRGNKWMKTRNIFIVFLVSGFWHGANWTFIVWGALHALFFLPLILTISRNNYSTIVAENRLFPTIKEFFLVLKTFGLVAFAFIVFRADNLDHAFQYIYDMFLGLTTISGYAQTKHFLYSNVEFVIPFLLVFFFLIEWMQRAQEFGIQNLGFKWKKSFRWSLYILLAITILLFSGTKQEYVYFQF